MTLHTNYADQEFQLLGIRTLEVEAEYCSQNQLPEIMETRVNC
ncbi:hypothetical protein [Corynebacterium phocae]|nr:hypothetical protein [Corynebacterium phocae]